MRVKICGIVRPEDGVHAAEVGAHAVGLNFIGGPRRVTPAQAEGILEHLPPLVTPVALISVEGAGPDPGLHEWLRCSRVRHLQVYGASSSDIVGVLAKEGFVVLPVLRIQNETLCDAAGEALLQSAAGVVLDAYDPEKLGGTGRAFCWDWVSQARRDGRLDRWPPILLAGGLTPENVAEAIRAVHPFGVDVSSGVEVDGRLGVKDPEKVMRFINNAMAADE